MARNAVKQASNAEQTAVNTGAGEGANASAIGSTLTPFLTQEMLNPTGYGQQGLSAMTAAAEGGAGGTASGLTGQAIQRAAASRNAGGYQAALDDVARQREKAAAGSSEQIAAQNAGLEQQQRQEGAEGLGKLYGTDTSAMLQAMGQEAPDVNAETNAMKTGWLQNATGLLQDAGSIAGLAGGFGIPGFSGFAKK